MKQPRHQSVHVKFAPGVTPTKVVVGPNRQLQFEDDDGVITPESGTWHFSYDRKNKPQPKELGRLELEPSQLNSEPLLVLQKYDSIIAVDTNTKLIRGERVSVGCAVQGTLNFDNLHHIIGSYWPTACIELRNATLSPERILWEMVLGGVERSDVYNSVRSIGVIVDSELGALADLNRRSEPIRGSFYVPAKCELIYASADKGTEWLGHHMIKLCDRIASYALKEIESDAALDSGLSTSRGDIYKKLRPWKLSLSKNKNIVSVDISPSIAWRETGWNPA